MKAKTRLLLLVLLLALPALARAESRWLRPTDPPEAAAGGYTGTVTLTFLGDCTLGGEQKSRNSALGFVRRVAENGMDFPFRNLLCLTREDDLTVANLEGVLTDRSLKKEKKKYNFSGPTAYTEILTSGSVECVTLANNHTHDYGAEGYADTVAALDGAGVFWFDTENTGIWETEDGVRIGFVGVSYSLTGNRYTRYAAQVQSLRDSGCAAVITVMHAGTEYEREPDRYQRQIVTRAAACGSDLVVGHHPHIVQGYGSEDGMPVVYSLGNCSFGGTTHAKDSDALALQAELVFRDGVLQETVLHFYPLSITSDERYNNYSPRLLTGADADRVLNKMVRSTGNDPGPFEDSAGAVVRFPARNTEPDTTEGESAMATQVPIQLLTSYKQAQDFNPLFTQRFGADPGVMEYDGRIYVYLTDDRLEHDLDGNVKENSYQMIRTVNCLSSNDLVNWTDHGTIEVAGASGAARWARNSWAPCAAHKTVDGKEKFFLYFCNGGNGIGVLTADSPTGPWKDERGSLLIDRSVPNCADVLWLFDPAVMVDEDGTGYLAFGGGVPEGQQAAPGTGRIVRLGADMISLDGDPARLEVPYLFEDSGINRIGDQYVYTYCSNFQAKGNALGITDGAIQYMTADSPLGPYTYRGEFFPNEGKFFGLYGNNHHSIACLNGQYYLFYHNRPVEKAMGIGGNYRSPQVDLLPVSEDGTLGPVTSTMAGVPQLKPFDPYVPVSACTMSHQAGCKVLGCGENARLRTAEGSWLRITGVDFGEGSSSLTLRASSVADCRVWVTLGSPEGPVAAELTVPAGSENAEITVPFSAAGVQDLYFVFGDTAEVFSWQAK